MAMSKGTKMPRGDKTSIMEYGVPHYDIAEQKKIAYVLRMLDKKIELNNKINNNLPPILCIARIAAKQRRQTDACIRMSRRLAEAVTRKRHRCFRVC